ncbi:MAG: glycosyltransferase family 9 protein [Rhodanobacteraceae bacterium]
MLSSGSDWHELRRRMTRTATGALLRHSPADSQSIASVPGQTIHRILICRPNHRLGNLLLLTPLLKELQQILPDAEVDIVLAGKDGAGLFRTFRNVGHIYTLSRRMVRHPLQTARIAAQLRRAHYDLVIDPCEGSQSSRWLIAIAHAAQVIGAPGDTPGADARQAPTHMAKWPVYLLRRALAAPDADYPLLDIQLTPAEQQRGQQILHVLTSAGTSLPRVIGVFAEARGAKRYPEAWWLRCIEVLRTQVPDARIVEIAPPDGHSRLSARFPNFFSPDIREVASVISPMMGFLSADCGVMHLACASGVPTFGLFSATDIAKYTPYGHGGCAIDTNGQSPEQVAQRVAAAMQTIQANGTAATPDPARGTSPARADGGD